MHMIPTDIHLVASTEERIGTLPLCESLHLSYLCSRLVFQSTKSSLNAQPQLCQDKSNSLVNSYKEISQVIEDLSTCAYTYEAFAELIGKLQATVCTGRFALWVKWLNVDF